MPKSKKKKKSKDKMKSFVTSAKILIPAVIILVLVATYIAVESFDKQRLATTEPNNEPAPIYIDDFSKEVFFFLNQFRSDSNTSKFDLHDEAYLVAYKMAEMKGYDSYMFREIEESNTFIEATGKLRDFNSVYPIIYEIEGPRIIEFENAFNRKYQLKRTILQDRYEAAAAGCGDSYCVVILLGNESIELRKDYY
jgi:hypothetical protein